jgi:hypothetical protein
MFEDRQTNVQEEEQSGRPSVVCDDLVQKPIKAGIALFHDNVRPHTAAQT